MSIINAFDPDRGAILSADRLIARVGDFPETVVVSFTQPFTDAVVEDYGAMEFDRLGAGREMPIHSVDYGGKKLGFFHTMIGGAANAGILEELIAKGARKFLFFGSCGSLDSAITAGHILVPDAAYRDEGASYHYLPPSDYVDVPTAGRLAEILGELGVPYIRTKTWTTDAIYRETARNAALRRAEGCAAVEMECASVMAVGQFRGVEVYQFIYAADCLDGEWDQRILGRMPDDMRETILRIALETAVRL